MKPTAELRCALYARVSTEEQDTDMQLAELREYVERRGWTVAGEYVDAGWSGAKNNRPQLTKLLTDAHRRKFDVVLVWKLDRWGRSAIHAVNCIQELVDLGIRWMAVTQGLDTAEDSPMGRFMIQILAAFAELERALIRERVKAGVKHAKKQGKHCGRPSRVFRRDEALEMKAAGASMRQIAAHFGVGKGTVQRLLAAAA